MNKLTYNLSMVAGTTAVSVGAGMQFGLPVGLMTVGALVIVLTVVALFLVE